MHPSPPHSKGPSSYEVWAPYILKVSETCDVSDPLSQAILAPYKESTKGRVLMVTRLQRDVKALRRAIFPPDGSIESIHLLNRGVLEIKDVHRQDCLPRTCGIPVCIGLDLGIYEMVIIDEKTYKSPDWEKMPKDFFGLVIHMEKTKKRGHFTAKTLHF